MGSLQLPHTAQGMILMKNRALSSLLGEGAAVGEVWDAHESARPSTGADGRLGTDSPLLVGIMELSTWTAYGGLKAVRAPGGRAVRGAQGAAGVVGAFRASPALLSPHPGCTEGMPGFGLASL